MQRIDGGTSAAERSSPARAAAWLEVDPHVLRRPEAPRPQHVLAGQAGEEGVVAAAHIAGKPVDPMNSAYFDKGLEARVRDYQIERRLTVDGKVGQQTLIAMNSDLDIGAPQLARLN